MHFYVICAVSEADSVVKVAEWQQTYYSSDSGIQSGATTVRDDESSTEYSGRKKFSGSATNSSTGGPAAATAGGGDSAGCGAESPSGQTDCSHVQSTFLRVCHHIYVCSFSFNCFTLYITSPVFIYYSF